MRDAGAPAALGAAEITAAQPPLERQAEFDDTAPALDVPPWPRDGLALSQRVRSALAALAPVAVRVRGFWDHVVRSVLLDGGRRLEIDAAGSYRLQRFEDAAVRSS